MSRILPLLFVFLFSSCYSSKQNNIAVPLYLQLLQGSQKTVTIVGDSLAKRSDAFGLSAKLGSGYDIVNPSVGGYTARDWLNDASVPFETQPDLLIIELGTNDADQYPTSDFKIYMAQLLQEFKNRTSNPIMLSLVPLTKNIGLQKTIQDNNSYLKSLSASYAICDLETPFQNALKTETLYPVADPLHPNTEGNNLIGTTYVQCILKEFNPH